MNDFDAARQKYRPKKVNHLLIAETPPKSNSNRFFYFEKVDIGDSLFLETMKLLYPRETFGINPKIIRKDKTRFLEKFKNDGWYLIDSLDRPFEQKYSQAKKIRLIESGQGELFEKIKDLSDSETKIILIAVTVYAANYSYLKTKGVNLLNTGPIDFPGAGGQKKYHQKMKKILDVIQPSK